MRTYFPALSLFFALAPLAVFADPKTAADHTAGLPITHVSLYTSGVGYFQRGGMVDGSLAETLLFPVGQVNDVLKSLVLLDSGGGSIQPVTYAAQDPLSKQLQAFSIDLSDNPDRATLLNRLRGVNAVITFSSSSAASQSLAGTIMGTESQTVTLPNNGGTTEQVSLNLLADEGMRSIPLSAISGFRLTDPKLNQEMRDALSAVAQNRDSNKRAITLNFSGHGRRNVLVGYLTEAPLWQTSYRLVLGTKPLLQGWALVQNTSQDDWNDVNLSLVSGQPISFIQDLYTPLYVPRPTVQARVQASITPQTYNSNMKDEEAANAPAPVELMNNAAGAVSSAQSASPEAEDKVSSKIAAKRADAGKYRAAMPSMDAREALQGAVSASGGKLGTALFSYQIKEPVSVPRQQSAMIPFISSGIGAESVSIYNAGVQAEHPLAGARIKNTSGLHLMGGPITIFDESGGGTEYVGDALIDDTEPNQTRLVSYAIDLAVDAEAKPGGGGGSEQTLTISQGVLIATSRETEAMVYTFKNHGAKPRIVVVEHPYRGDDWKLLEPKAANEHTAQYDRFDLTVPAGAAKSLTVRAEHPNSSTYALLDSSEDTLLYFSKNGQASEELKATLKDLIVRRRHVAEIQQQLDNRNAVIQSISSGQQRIRDNMKALDHASPLYKRYVSELDKQETKLDSLHAEAEALQQQHDLAQADLNNYIAHLTLK